VRFWIEPDRTQYQTPAVYLTDLLRARRAKGKPVKPVEGKYYRVKGRLYRTAISASTTKPTTFDTDKKFDRFVSLMGLTDGADPNQHVTFSVYADGRRLFQSERLTSKSDPVAVDVRISGRTRQIKLAVAGSDEDFVKRWAKWINPGLMLKGKAPTTSVVTVYPPAIEMNDFEPAVVATSGRRLEQKVLWDNRGEPMSILFKSAPDADAYFVYFVPEDNRLARASNWKPKAGLILETRHTDDRDIKDLEDFREEWNGSPKPVGRSVVDSIHHGYPMHRTWPGAEDSLRKAYTALYRYEGYFKIDKAGQYTFATSSTKGSYLFIDGKEVVAWPGARSIRDGIRGQKNGKINLNPGIHKIEYLNSNSRGKMAALAAKANPGGKLQVMMSEDFVPIRPFVATVVGYNERDRGGAFHWRIVDDLQTDQTSIALVKMQFAAIPTENRGDLSYRWRFDDGAVSEGLVADHVFLTPGIRTVTLEVLRGTTVADKITRDVWVHPLENKLRPDPINPETFEQALASRDLRAVPLEDLISLYRLGDKTYDVQWKQRAAASLAARAAEFAGGKANADFHPELVRYLTSPLLREYDKALGFVTRLAQASQRSTRLHREAAILQTELLIECFGEYELAIEVLDGLAGRNSWDSKTAERYEMARARALIHAGEVRKAREILEKLKDRDKSSSESDTGDHIKHVGTLRHARQLALGDDPVQLDHAMKEIETLIAENPMSILAPNVNLVKLDIHLARREYDIALHLTDLLQNLDLNDFFRAEILARRVAALCHTKAMDEAKSTYETIKNEYPLSPAAVRARKALIEAIAPGPAQ